MRYYLLCTVALILLGCGRGKPGKKAVGNYKSENLIIRKISDNAYLHTSFMNVEGFGRVSCNGAVFFDRGEAVIFDTPGLVNVSEELIRWTEDSLKCRIRAVVPTHFHTDCLGGLDAFHKRKIPSYASNATIALARSNGTAVPQQGFDVSEKIKVGDREVFLEYLGEGHTRDNIVGYFPGDEIVFGGCLVKASGAGKGNLEDANTKAWPETVRKLKSRHPEVRMVIPGHGEAGGTELLDYTIKLFERK